jgi:hypothetical protein
VSTASSAGAFLELLRRRRCVPRAVVVDLAGDDAALEHALRGAGLVPLGLVAGPTDPGRTAWSERETVTGDLSTPDDLFEDLVVRLVERHVAAVWLGDATSRAAGAGDLVRAAHWFGEQTGAALGLQEATDGPGSAFTGEALAPTMATLGWAEVDREELVRLYEAVMPVHPAPAGHTVG